MNSATEIVQGVVNYKFKIMLSSLAKAPAIYVGKANIETALHFLNGYGVGLEHVGLISPLAGWGRWVEKIYETSDPSMSWAAILRSKHGNDKAALQALPELYERFCTERGAAHGQETS